jgi:hypothetical protein
MNSTEDEISIEIERIKEELGAEVDFDTEAMFERLKQMPESTSNPRVSFSPRPVLSHKIEPAA